jgi:cytosine/adenosine deaminase-related metal-dependent hydrolase
MTDDTNPDDLTQNRQVDLLVDGGTVLTLDAERRILADGAIAVRGNRIVDIGPRREVTPRWDADRVVDASGTVITPGLIQAHVHVSTEQALTGVLPDTMPPSQWVREVTKFYAETTAAEEEIISLATFAELLQTGTTTFIEAGTTKHTAEVVAAMGRTGIRGCVGRWSWDRPAEPASLAATTDEAITRTADLMDRFHGAHDGRVSVWATPIGHTMTSDELLVGLKNLADERGTGFTCHLSSWIEDVEGYLAATGKRPVMHYRDLGVLGPNVVLAHMVNIDEEEIATVLETDTRIAHCPTTAGWFGYGVTQVSRFPEMIAAGATIGIGCDAKCCANHLDVVRAMYTTAVLFRDARRDMAAMTAEDVLEMATLHGARCALMEDRIGSLEVGKLADLVVFDTTRPEWQPVHHPVANLVFGADGHSVRTVVVDGRVVVDDGQLPHIDLDELRPELAAVGRSLLSRTGVEPRSAWPIVT